MPIELHYHRYPSCGTQCNTACSAVKGVCRNCFMAEHGPHKGEFACIHVYGEITENDVSELARELIGSLPEPTQEQTRKE